MTMLNKMVNGVPTYEDIIGCLSDADKATQHMVAKRNNLLNNLTEKLVDNIFGVYITDMYGVKGPALFVDYTSIMSSYSQVRCKVLFKNGYMLSIVWNGPDFSYGASELLFECACMAKDMVLIPLKESVSKSYYGDTVIGWMNDKDIIKLAKYISENGDEIKKEASELGYSAEPYDLVNF